jgi:hypothetical protein
VTEPCPCCRAEAGASPHPELRYACDVCGGPRVPRLDRSLHYGGREAPLLRRADAARKARAGWRAATVAGGLLLPFMLAVFAALLLIVGLGVWILLVALLVVLPIAGFLVLAITRGSARGREIAPALDAAWLSVATDIAEQTRGLTAPVLAQKLGIEEPQAEELMALVDVNAAVSPPRPPKARIDEEAGAAPMGDAQGFPQLSTPQPEEEEAALAERIEARAREPDAGKP